MMENTPLVTVVLSTYNQPAWLAKVLVGYSVQTEKNFEIVLADDGSGEETQRVIEEAAAHAPFPIRAVRQEHNDFGKCRILNLALLAASADYLIFSDGDCIPREDLVRTHLRHREPGRFLTHGTVRLPPGLSTSLTPDDIACGRCFRAAWLFRNGLSLSRKNLKLVRGASAAWLLNRLTPAKPTWNGCGSSGWKKDILAANGFDCRMRYGGEDLEFGERLRNMGVRPRQIRYSTTSLHLHHERPYNREEGWRINREIRNQVRQERLTRTAFGIAELAESGAHEAHGAEGTI